MISYRVMKTLETENYSMYRIACDCGDPDCDLTFAIEVDEDGMMFLNFYKNLEWSSYWGDSIWPVRIWRRIKCAFKVLFTGYIKVEDSLVIQDYSHIRTIIEALDESSTILMENRAAYERDNPPPKDDK